MVFNGHALPMAQQYESAVDRTRARSSRAREPPRMSDNDCWCTLPMTKSPRPSMMLHTTSPFACTHTDWNAFRQRRACAAAAPSGIASRAGAWMGLPIHVEQLGHVHVRVALRRRQLDVAEQFLDGAQVRAGLQQMRRKRMPQRVRADAEACAAAADVAGDQALHAAPRQPAAARVHKQRISARQRESILEPGA